MSLTVLCTLIGLGVLCVVALAIIIHCAFRVFSTWMSAKQGRTTPAVVQSSVIGGLLVVLVKLGFDPPWPIDWNAPAASLDGWNLYYVIVIAPTQAWASAAAALLVVLLAALITALHKRSRLAHDAQHHGPQPQRSNG